MTPLTHMGCFLAHAVVLEDEAAGRYDELADAMATHRNRETEALFRRMAGHSRQHRDEAIERARRQGGGLPDLKPWEFAWPDAESPESGDMGASHYLMTPHHALELARAAELGAERFYRHVAEASEDAAIKALAAEFADEEAEHAQAIERWMASTPEPPEGWHEDPDPPVEVE